MGTTKTPEQKPALDQPKYFDRRGNRDWSFFGETCDDEGRPNKVWLYYAKGTPIKRHIKVKGEANPYDPTYETYFEEREGAQQLLEGLPVAGVSAEVAIVLPFEVQWNIGIALRLEGNGAFPLRRARSCSARQISET